MGFKICDSVPLGEQDVKNLGNQIWGTRHLLKITKTEITERNFSGS